MVEWKDAFSKGVACFQAQRYEDALRLLSHAINLHARDSTVFDSRAAVHEKLGRTKEALLDSKQVIKLSPERWQGYARSARLFFSIKKFESALRMTDLAHERIKPEDTKRRTELEALRSDIETTQAAHTRRQRQRACTAFYHFGRLPVEIAHGIFSLVVEEDHTQVVVLGQVCRDWRCVVVETPNLWTHLSLSTVNPIVKATLWKTRSRGKLKALCIRSGDAKTMWALQVLETTSLDGLQTLSLAEVDICALRQRLPLLSHEIICHLDRLELHNPLPTMDIHRLFHSPTLQLRTLSVRGVFIPWGDLTERCEKLTTLSYHGCFNATYLHDLTSFLQRNTRLEVVEFFAGEDAMSWKYQSFVSTPVHPSSTDRVPLSTLTKLALGGPFLGSDLFCKLLCPNLRSLHISKWTGTIDVPLDHARTSSAAAPLEELIIDRCSLLDPTSLVRFLESAKNIRTLHLLGMTNAGVVLQSLAEPRSNEILCPQLTHLNVSHCPDVRDGPLLRLVKVRLPLESLHSAEDIEQGEARLQASPRPSPLMSLILDGCQTITAEILPWLRQNVPHVRCQFATKKQASWKR